MTIDNLMDYTLAAITVTGTLALIVIIVLGSAIIAKRMIKEIKGDD